MLKSNFKTEELLKYLPHRPPMVWIDEVVDLTETKGFCRVVVDKNKHYCDENGSIRPSALIEWMAQAYAFSGVLRESLKPGGKQTLKKAFLAGFSKFELLDNKALQSEKEFLVEVEKTHDFAPITLISAKVLTQRGDCVASAALKLYAEVG